ncbi:hypothetical protein Agub_g4754 [Astrephomene gubernaculifera]|uniref:Uncharacterized protein n=1 Tax=Astrephomene gubernaculifera TaxID=47775 RepID=A0AAD3DKQ0_9CHLO|nr:hypothetical protein Agub_g4754 [Astrephomene gubernaculifera]
MEAGCCIGGGNGCYGGGGSGGEGGSWGRWATELVRRFCWAVWLQGRPNPFRPFLDCGGLEDEDLKKFVRALVAVYGSVPFRTTLIQDKRMQKLKAAADLQEIKKSFRVIRKDKQQHGQQSGAGAAAVAAEGAAAVAAEGAAAGAAAGAAEGAVAGAAEGAAGGSGESTSSSGGSDAGGGAANGAAHVVDMEELMERVLRRVLDERGVRAGGAPSPAGSA